MELTLAEFKALVSDGLGRGTTLDSVIGTRIAMAVQWLERNYTFQYMRQWTELQALTSAQFPYIVSLHNMRIKGIELIRQRTSDNEGGHLFGRPLKRVHPGDRESRSAGPVESYWPNGVSSIILNSIPTEDLTFEAHIKQFTAWGTADDFTHWLMDNATQLLLARTMMMLVPRTRDPKLWQTYKAEFDLELQSFNVSEEEIQANDFVSVWEPQEFAQNDESLRSA